MLIEFNLDFWMQNYKKISKNERINTEILGHRQNSSTSEAAELVTVFSSRVGL